MACWIIQLHPNESDKALQYTTQSLTVGCIGLDFANDVGDLRQTTKDTIPEVERVQWAFLSEMEIGDDVLVIAHNIPFALVKVIGPYNYAHSPLSEIGAWFRHYRYIGSVRYYGDFVKGLDKWESITMLGTICKLRDQNGRSFRLIGRWLQHSP